MQLETWKIEKYYVSSLLMLSAWAAEKLFISNPEKLSPQNKQKNRTHICISAESIALHLECAFNI